MKKILSILIAMTLMISLFSGVAFAGSSSSGGMIIMRKTEEPAKEPEAEEATPAEATPAEPEAEETTPAEATPVEPEEVVEEATPVEPEEVIEETTPVEAEEVIEEATAEVATEAEAEEVVEETTPVEPEEEIPAEATAEEAPVEEVPVVIPEEATKVFTLQDALDPSRSIDIWAVFEGDVLHAGMNVTLFAAFNGYENLTYTFWWEMNAGSDWQAVGEPNSLSYSFILNEQLYNASWRVVVEISAGEIAEPTHGV